LAGLCPELAALADDVDAGINNLIAQRLAEIVDEKTNQTALHALARLYLPGESNFIIDKGHVDRLLEAGCPLDSRDYVGRTPLILASLNNNVTMVKFLLDAGADVNARDSAGNTATGCLPLGRGERHNDVQQEESMIIARMLINSGAMITTSHERWCLSLMDAKREASRIKLDVAHDTPGSLSANYVDGMHRYHDLRATLVPPSGTVQAPARAPTRVEDSRWMVTNGKYGVTAAPQSGQFILNPWERSNLEKCLGTQPPMVTRFDPDLAPSLMSSTRGAAFIQNSDSFY